LNNGTVIADCASASLVFSNDVVNYASIIVTNGGVVDFFGSAVNYGVINALYGTANFHSTFSNNGILITTSSIPRIVSVVATNSSVQISFTTGSTAPYAVDYSDDLVAGNWNPLTNNITGTGATITATDSSAGTRTQRFYRVRLVVPP
jgi:hypothetical protein